MFIYLVKELRQLRRDSVFYGTLVLQLGLNALVLALNKDDSTAAAEICNLIWLAAAVIIAVTMASRWREELNDDALNPMVTTPLSPVSVVAGKFLATFIAVLIPAAVAQVFNFCALPAENLGRFFGRMLPIDAASVLTASALILAFVSVFKKRGAAVLPGMFVLFALLSLHPAMMVVAARADQGIGTYPNIWAEMFKLLLPIPFLFSLTVAAVSPAASDRAVPVRIVFLCSLAAYTVIETLPDSFSTTKLMNNVSGNLYAGAFFTAVAAAVERRAQSRRVAAAIRRTHPALRPLRILCSSGAVPELVLSLVLLAAALATEPDGDRIALYSYTVLLFYTVLTLFVSGMIKLSSNKEPSRVGIFIAAVGLGTLAGLIFPLPPMPTAFMADMGNAWNVIFAILNLLSLLLLIPTVTEFVQSLQRE